MVSWFRMAIGLLVGSALVAVLSRPVVACTRVPPPPALEGYPREGSTDVPTDVVPVFDSLLAPTSEAVRPGPMFTLKSDAGDSIALAPRRRHQGHFELVPALPLAPRTRYTLRGVWAPKSAPLIGSTLELSLSFTTGEGPLSQPPAPPQAKMQHYTTPQDGNSCAPPSIGTCVSAGDDFVEYVFEDGLNDPETLRIHPGVHGPYLSRRGMSVNLSGMNQGTNFLCVQLRTRAANGTYSDKVVLCGADAPHYALPAAAGVTCGPEGLRYQGRPATEFPTNGSGSGFCAFGGTRSPGAAGGWVGLAGLVALGLRLARRRRGPAA